MAVSPSHHSCANCIHFDYYEGLIFSKNNLSLNNRIIIIIIEWISGNSDNTLTNTNVSMLINTSMNSTIFAISASNPSIVSLLGQVTN